MESQKLVNSDVSRLTSDESSTFICTECGDGFTKYSNMLIHMTIHGPLESFPLDGSSNGFEFPREYVLQENGTLTVVNGLVQPHSSVTPVSSEVLPSHFQSHVKPVSSNLQSQSSVYSEVVKQKPAESEKPHQGHFRCDTCCKLFNNLLNLHCHQQYRNTESGYRCTLCCKVFSSTLALKDHVRGHASEQVYFCDNCGKRFLKRDALNAHQKESHVSPKTTTLGKSENNQDKKVEKTYPCKKCKQIFFWVSDFQTHSLYHCKGKERDVTFSLEMELKSKNVEDVTRENCHSNGTSVNVKDVDDKDFGDTSPAVAKNSTFTPYRCGLCGDCFPKLADLKEHHLTHQTQEEIDKLNQESQISLKQKFGLKSRRVRRANPNGKLHPCKHCHRVFNHSSSLSRHMRYHKGTMHTCTFCGRHFPQRCDVRRHMAMYHKAELDKKPALKHLALPSCPKNGSVPNSLIDGENKSSLDNDHAALEPQQKVQQPGKVGRVNYKCQECGKRFGLLCVYQRHLRYHKKEPSKSPQHLTRFKNSSSLDNCLKNRTTGGDVGKTPLATDANDDPILHKGNSEDLEDDYMDHTQNDKGNSSEALYECTECTKTFTCLETFLQHQSTHGSENAG
ncbi:zinc finger protein 836 [Thalassophryne amazonica]|uniref:zinc finger protein 836 n=1 Tax=Thalassophryne amazonica TaxID=390379 RepID=UPI001470AE21|nr:zinc finger protein 836 [Thalassophryne amazonica]XP_034031000.1 zinc finger protein 836 [Thalassophryne amazonica]XP_034031001.1 zinc finger protein 836 [Thalassophryne amazonica]